MIADPTNDSWIRRKLPTLIRGLLGRGMRANQQGLIEWNPDETTGLGIRQGTGKGYLNLSDQSALEVVAGSPYGLKVAWDEESMQIGRRGRLESRPPMSYVRNDSDIPGLTLADVLDLTESRFRGFEAAGDAFPVELWDGRFYYRTDLGEVFFYSGSRATWLSLRSWKWTGTSGMGLAGAYFNEPGGLPLSATLGYPAPFNMIVVEVGASKSDTVNDPTYEVHANGVSIHGFQIGAGSTSLAVTGLNVSVTAGQVVGFFLNGTMANGGHCEAILRRTAT